MSDEPMSDKAMSVDEIRAKVASNPFWYHTMDVAPGVTTPGWFDLRSVVDDLPWPDVRGKRCLDVGTADGFLAFELEKRGAADVVATDINDHTLWDWPADARTLGPAQLNEIAGPEKGRGFPIAKEALGSKVEREWINVYDISPERLGTFDVVVMGALLLHLQNPIKALEAVRTVCRGQFLSMEQVHLPLSLLLPKKPVAFLKGIGQDVQWWIPNAAAHKQMLRSAGFEIERSSGRVKAGPYGPANPAAARVSTPKLVMKRYALEKVATGGVGVPWTAHLTHPRL